MSEALYKAQNFTRPYNRPRFTKPSAPRTRALFRDLMSKCNEDQAAWCINQLENFCFDAMVFDGNETVVDLEKVT
eukprot:UN26195